MNNGGMGIGESLRYASFQVVSIITTTGFGSSDYEIWPYFAQMIILVLFFTGGCAGSTAGGMKMIRWLILLKNNIREIRQIVHPKAILPLRVGPRVIDPAVQRTILSFFVMYFLAFFIGTFLLAMTGEDLLSSISASISCLGNIGPAFGQHGPTENYAILNSFGKWVMVVQMMIGRLELFTVIVLFSPSFWKQ
jgi:trk system potassium uptake protein TrkH